MEVACARLTFDVTIALHATVLTEFGSPLLVAHGRYQTSKCAAAMVWVRACSRLAQWLATVDNTNTIFERSGGGRRGVQSTRLWTHQRIASGAQQIDASVHQTDCATRLAIHKANWSHLLACAACSGFFGNHHHSTNSALSRITISVYVKSLSS